MVNRIVAGPWLVGVLGLGASLMSQGPGWVYQPSLVLPINRANHAMAFDQARGRTLLFGGNNSALLGDTWTWDGSEWLQVITPSGPTARTGHAMAYDAVRQRVVLFGGAGGIAGQAAFGDTWEWDGASWVAIGPVPGPAARRGHTMVYDSARSRVVLFGGKSGVSPYPLLADTWEWDGTNWTPRLSALFPPARTEHSMAYDSVRQRCVVFGGEGVGADTWVWNGATWAQVSPPTSPPARKGHTMAFDAVSQVVLLHSGISGSTVFDDTWSWDGTSWVQISTSASPMPRWDGQMVFDSLLGCVTLYGGTTVPAFLADTWVLGGTPATAITYGAGCGVAPVSLGAEAGSRPILGTTSQVIVANPPTPLVAVAIGASRQMAGAFPLPLPLGGLGMTGCFMYQSADAMGLATATVPGGQRYSLAIPPSPWLVRLHLYLQAYGYAPGVNPLEIVVSNGMDWKIGDM